jgi:hypothetical protein
MNAPLRERISRKLETLSDERLYQVLDYVEFLESRYAQRQAPGSNVFQRFAETVEDRLRAGRVSASTIAETMTLMNKAMGVLSGVAAAGKSVANDIVGVATRPTGSGPGTAAPPASGAAPSGPSSTVPSSTVPSSAPSQPQPAAAASTTPSPATPQPQAQTPPPPPQPASATNTPPRSPGENAS